MTNPDKKAKTVFNRNAENYIRNPDDVARAIAAVKKRNAEKYAAAEQQKTAEQARVFAGYMRNLEPMFEILENLPRDKNNHEFFIRRDLSSDKKADDGSIGNHINIWLIYGRQRTAPLTATPDTHAVTFAQKNKDKNPDVIEKTQNRIRVALGVKPVVSIQAFPTTSGDVITSTVYKERYIRDTKDMSQAGRRGDFVEAQDIQRKEVHTSLRDVPRIIHDWIKDVAPERTEEIRQALAVLETATLQDAIKISRPLTLKKHPPHSPKGG